MNKPLLKILPGVAIMMISPSCSKDTDIIDEDNAALVAEQVIQKKVFYIKVKNASSLKKMGIEGLGTEGTKALKFEKGDKLKLKFVVKGDNSGTIEDETAFAEANCISTDGVFEVTNYWLNNSYAYAGDAIEVALQEMQDGVFDAA